jgi:hypothetical protein
MAHFTLGIFTFGSVLFDGWDCPVAREKVGLRRECGDLIVSHGFDPEIDEVSYTWPRGISHSEAAACAARHYERKTGVKL